MPTISPSSATLWKSKPFRGLVKSAVDDDPDFVEHHKEDLAASLEWTIVDILMKKLRLAVKQTGIKHVAVAGGVSANNGLRNAFQDHARRYGWTIYIPKFSYTTDNAAMIAKVGEHLYKRKMFAGLDLGVDPNWRIEDFDKYEN